MLIYKKGSVFDAPIGSTLVHACNAQGVWGSGVAKEFRLRFPEAYKVYAKTCGINYRNRLGRSSLCGAYLDIPGEKYDVGCLFTSNRYGEYVDAPDMILDYTDSALRELFSEMNTKFIREVHSPKINSGLFNVPWEYTEELIKDYLDQEPQINWTVWEYEPSS